MAASHDVPPWRGPDPRPNDIKRKLTSEGHVGGCRWVLQLHISLVILITFTLDDLLMLSGENWFWSLLRPKGLRSTLYSQGCASTNPMAPAWCLTFTLSTGWSLVNVWPRWPFVQKNVQFAGHFEWTLLKINDQQKRCIFTPLGSGGFYQKDKYDYRFSLNVFAYYDNNFNIIIDQSEET